MKTFEIGKTYTTRSVCDHNCIFSAKILKRTAKTVTIKTDGDVVRRKIEVWNDAETFFPFGKYSMAAIISAN